MREALLGLLGIIVGVLVGGNKKINLYGFQMTCENGDKVKIVVSCSNKIEINKIEALVFLNDE